MCPIFYKKYPRHTGYVTWAGKLKKWVLVSGFSSITGASELTILKFQAFWRKLLSNVELLELKIVLFPRKSLLWRGNVTFFLSLEGLANGLVPQQGVLWTAIEAWKGGLVGRTSSCPLFRWVPLVVVRMANSLILPIFRGKCPFYRDAWMRGDKEPRVSPSLSRFKRLKPPFQHFSVPQDPHLSCVWPKVTQHFPIFRSKCLILVNLQSL